MTNTPLQDGVRALIAAVRAEEWTLSRALRASELEKVGSEARPEVKDLVARSVAGRHAATAELRQVLAGEEADDCVEPAVEAVGTWAEVQRGAHDATAALLDTLRLVSEEQLAVSSGPERNHPQYCWRDVLNHGVRPSFLSYSAWHRSAGRGYEALATLARWYEAARGAGLPTKVLSDASYDLACGLAQAGRLDDAMVYLPDAFTYNDRGAVPVLKAWARQDRELAPLADRSDFQRLIG
jgi:hypothetical protein